MVQCVVVSPRRPVPSCSLLSCCQSGTDNRDMGTTASRPLLQHQESPGDTLTDQEDEDQGHTETCWGLFLRKVCNAFGLNYQTERDTPSTTRRKRRISETESRVEAGDGDLESACKSPRLSGEQDISAAATASTRDKEEFVDTLTERMGDTETVQRVNGDGPDLERASHVGRVEYMDFPFLTDLKARSHLSRTRTMIVLRGLPGSGKSTIVRRLEEIFPEVVTCSADQFFVSASGDYDFDVSLLGEAHSWCQSKAEQACLNRANILIVDNTNVKRWEMVPYFKIASKHRYLVLVVEPKTPWKLNIEELERRNSHGVDRSVISRRCQDWQSVRPQYYGWFLSLLDSRLLLSRAREVLRLCLAVPALLKELADVLGGERVEVEDILNLYSRDNIFSGPMCHSTARFVRKSDAGELPQETDRLGQVSSLTVAGFTLTPRTFGARLVLSQDQLEVYRQRDDEPFSLPPHHLPNKPQRPPTVPLPEPDCRGMEGSLKEVEGPRLDILGGVRGRRAHITLGCVGHTRPVQTGVDQLELLRTLEANDQPERVNFQEGSVISLDQKGSWVISLDRPITVTSVFTGSY